MSRSYNKLWHILIDRNMTKAQLREARQNMHDLVDSDANKVTKVFSTLFGR